MNNNIRESYCSFEVGKLLKEKGFNVDFCETYYNINNGIFLRDRHWSTLDDIDQIIAPTYSIAIEWIKVNFDYWITISPTVIQYNETEDKLKWHFSIRSLESFLKNSRIKNTAIDNSTYYGCPEDATEAAILYTLQNLIK